MPAKIPTGDSKVLLTFKQKRFAEAFAKCGNTTEASHAVYNAKTPQVAYHLGLNTLKNPNVQVYLHEILEKYNLSLDDLSKATAKIVESGMRKRVLKQVTPSDTLRAIEMSYKLHDAFPSDRVIDNSKNLNIQLNNKSDNELIDQLSTMIEEAKHIQTMLSNQTKPVIQEASVVSEAKPKPIQ